MNQNNQVGCSTTIICPIAVEPWNTFDAGNTDFRTPYVGFSPNAADFKTVGISAYDALEAHVEKRLSHHFQIGASYTWSHSLDEQSDIGLFFTGDNPNHLRDSWASSDFDRTHVFIANFQVDVPNMVKSSNFASYITNDWHFTGIGTLQSGEPYSLYEFYGAVGSINFGNFPTLMNPVLGIKDPKHPKTALTGNKGSFRAPGGNYIPVRRPLADRHQLPAAGHERHSGFNGRRSVGYLPDGFQCRGSAISSARHPQKRLDLSFRKGFKITEKIKAQYELNVFNLTNTTSLDVPQNQAQIRQNNGCSATAIAAYGGGNNCNKYRSYLGYGQVVTSNNPTDQQTALANLDQVPFSTGTGKVNAASLNAAATAGLLLQPQSLTITGTSYLPQQRCQLWVR